MNFFDGQLKLAKENYEQSLKLDPANSNAEKMLGKIKAQTKDN